MSAIVDTTVLSNFAAAQRLDLLPLLWNEIYIAYPVFEEIRKGVEDGYEFLRSVEKITYPLHPDGWLKIVFLEDPREVELLAKLPNKLHFGEAVSIAIAAVRGWMLLTDDRAARLHATQMKVQISGTLGILASLVRRGFLSVSEANDILRCMVVCARYRTPFADLNDLLSFMEREG